MFGHFICTEFAYQTRVGVAEEAEDHVCLRRLLHSLGPRQIRLQRCDGDIEGHKERGGAYLQHVEDRRSCDHRHRSAGAAGKAGPGGKSELSKKTGGRAQEK